MVGQILLLIGIILIGIPFGVISIVNCVKSKGKRRFIFLPFAIAGLVLILVSFGGAFSSFPLNTGLILYFVGFGVCLVALVIAVHFRRKYYNRIFDDKKKEHEESVKQILINEQVKMDRVSKLEELLKNGEITQEEFDKKKKEILE